ncbi:MAG: potassium channel protein [Acidobacteria bacterium]|nr:potassium channel protein [Acidobacteriota bacterium]MBI3423449.1 potassium channel protein [Acidobacteriota bacterium]
MPTRKKIYFSIAALVALLIGGTLGYHFIEGWPLFDGLYMTVITLATIGYGEVQTLSQTGRAFTIVLIVFGVAFFGFLLSTLTQALIESELANTLGRRRVFRDISQLKNHYILCGAGKVGLRIIEEIKKKGEEFVIIERDEQVAERLLTQGHLVLIGDATDEAVLEGARVATARALITAASSDPENVYIALTARGMNPELYIVSRATDAHAERQLMRAGANKVVSPALIASHRMAQAALSPAVADFIELTTMTESLDLHFDQIRIAAGSPLDGQKIKEANVRAEYNVMLVAITPAQGAMIFNPKGEQTLHAGDMLIAIGNRAGLSHLARVAAAERGHKAKS